MGDWVGSHAGKLVGGSVECVDGLFDGRVVGKAVGFEEGRSVGDPGVIVGSDVGSRIADGGSVAVISVG